MPGPKSRTVELSKEILVCSLLAREKAGKGISMQKSFLQVGDCLPPLVKHMTLDKMSQPLMALRNPLHYDHAFAKQNGLPAPIAAGMMSCAYLSQVLAKSFGTDWFRASKFKTTFIKPVFAGDTITAKGVVRATVQGSAATEVTLEVWCENQKGEKVTIGEAVVTVGAYEAQSEHDS